MLSKVYLNKTGFRFFHLYVTWLDLWLSDKGVNGLEIVWWNSKTGLPKCILRKGF
jgi:hypothetical protein